MYLISAGKYEDACYEAEERGLKKEEWAYVPYEPMYSRRRAIRGRRAKPEELIGDFSASEIFFLTGGCGEPART